MQSVGLLLRDFEEQGSDVIWEIDAAAACHVSSHLAEALGRGTPRWNDRSLLACWPSCRRICPRASANRLVSSRAAHRSQPVPGRAAADDGRRPAALVVDDRQAAGQRARHAEVAGAASPATSPRPACRSAPRPGWRNNDTPTGLTNRAHFRCCWKRCSAALAREQVGGPAHCGAVMCLDLDGFKNVNDTWATPPATRCWSRWRAGIKEAAGRARWRPGSAATSSPC